MSMYKSNKKSSKRMMLVLSLSLPLLLLVLFANVLLFANAQAAHAIAYPAGTLAYVPITITNGQSASTPAPFQQRVLVNVSRYAAYLDTASLQNVEFFYANGTVIPSWLESYVGTTAICWLKLSGGMPAMSSITVYMGIVSKYTSLFNADTRGEAPQLSQTYAQYDNGAQVFGFYDNFKGTSLSDRWNISSNVSASANDGLHVMYNSGFGYLATKEQFGLGTATDSYITYFEDPALPASPNDPVNFGYMNITQPQTVLGTFGWAFTGIRSACSNLYPTQINASGEASVCGSTFGSFFTGGTAGTSWPPAVYTVEPVTPVSSIQFVNYSAHGTTQPIIGDAPAYSASVGYLQMGLKPNPVHLDAYWVRVRNAPPNGVMPNVTFNAITMVSSGCTNSNNGGTVSIKASNLGSNTIQITNQSAVQVTGSSDNVTINMPGSNCNIAVKVTGSSDRINIYNGTITLTESGSNDVTTLHNTTLSMQTMTGSADKISGAIINGNTLTITGSSDLVESVLVLNLASLQITGSRVDITMSMLAKRPVAISISGSYDILRIINGTVSLKITGSSDTVYYNDTTITSQSITGSGDKIIKN